MFYTSDWYSFIHLFQEARKKDKYSLLTAFIVDSDGVTKSYNFRTEKTLINFVLNKCIPSIFSEFTLELACIQIRGPRTATVTFGTNSEQPNYDLLDSEINKHLL